MCRSGCGCYNCAVWPYHFQTACYSPATSPGQKEGQDPGSFQEIGAKWSSKLRAKIALFRGIKLPRKGGKWQKKGGKVLNLGVSAFSGLECWTGVMDWSTGMESLEWSEALEWACDHFWESFRHFSTMVLINLH